jgi:hypothetical protein
VSTGVNFDNILGAAFLHKSLVLEVKVKIYIGAIAHKKMLVKLTPGGPRYSLF